MPTQSDAYERGSAGIGLLLLTIGLIALAVFALVTGNWSTPAKGTQPVRPPAEAGR